MCVRLPGAGKSVVAVEQEYVPAGYGVSSAGDGPAGAPSDSAGPTRRGPSQGVDRLDVVSANDDWED